jgi:hypothetical protein
MKIKLSRKRKKKYKKILKKVGISYSHMKNKEEWEWFYFRRRIEVRCMEVILSYPEYNIETGKYEFDPKLRIDSTNEELLEWYKKYYPNDKLSHHCCKENRHKWDKFNNYC